MFFISICYAKEQQIWIGRVLHSGSLVVQWLSGPLVLWLSSSGSPVCFFNGSLFTCPVVFESSGSLILLFSCLVVLVQYQ